MAEEKRQNTRVPFHTTITVRFPDKTFNHCATQDLSLKGVFVEGITGPRKTGDLCELSLHLSGTSSDLSLHMSGEVVRVKKNGIGLHFNEIDLDSFFHLKNIIYFNTEDPDILGDEFPNDESYPSFD
ncbi:MAG: PilZ domain-containing protein [Desulfobulbaceae bacterium]|nr:PilZ domain-containing protein [Desulfobulbaceae bacterium]